MKNIKHNFKYYLIWLMIAFLGCNSPAEPDTSTLGFAYFPLKQGDARTYQIVKTEYLPDGTVNSSFWQLKEVVAASFDSNGVTSFNLERYIRQNADALWTIDAVWSARRNNYQAIVVEENVPIIKMSFPIAEDRKWDGNAMNALAEDEYKMKNVDVSYTLGDLSFAKSLEVYKEDLLDPCKIASDNYHLEVFAEGVGLIYKHDIDIKYINSSGCSAEGDIDFGLVVEQKLIDFVTIE